MNTKTALVAISKKGARLVQDLEELEGDKDVFINRRWFVSKDGRSAFDLPIKPTIQKIFTDYQKIILIMPVGAAMWQHRCLHINAINFNLLPVFLKIYFKNIFKYSFTIGVLIKFNLY